MMTPNGSRAQPRRRISCLARVSVMARLQPSLRNESPPLHAKEAATQGGRGLFSYSGDRTRTCDPLVNSQLLYQLSYAGPLRMSLRGGA